MIRSLVAATLAIALTACASYPVGSAPGDAGRGYAGPYYGGSPPSQGVNGDYDDDQSPLWIVGTPYAFGEPWPGFGWDYAWWGFGTWWGYGPGWCCHHRHHHWTYAPAVSGRQTERAGPRRGQPSSFRSRLP